MRAANGESNASFMDDAKQMQSQVCALFVSCSITAQKFATTNKDPQLLRRQDLKVDEMQRGTQRLGEMADAINIELEAQGEALDELGNDIDTVNDRMEAVIVKMEELLQTKNRCSLGFIVFLVIVMFVLLCLVIWT